MWFLVSMLVIHDLSDIPQVSFRAAFRMFSLSLTKSQKLQGPNASFSALGNDCLSGAVHAMCSVLGSSEDDLEATAVLYSVYTAAQLRGV